MPNELGQKSLSLGMFTLRNMGLGGAPWTWLAWRSAAPRVPPYPHCTHPSSLFGGPVVNPLGSTVPEGRGVSHGLFVASVLSEFKTESFSGQYFFACQNGWMDM